MANFNKQELSKRLSDFEGFKNQIQRRFKTYKRVKGYFSFL